MKRQEASPRVYSFAVNDPRGLYPGLLLKIEVMQRLQLLGLRPEFEIAVKGDSFQINRQKYLRDNFVPEAFGQLTAEGEGIVQVKIEFKPSEVGQNWITGSRIGLPATFFVIVVIESLSLIQTGRFFLPVMILPIFPTILLLVAYAQLYFESNDMTYEIHRVIGEGGGLSITMDPRYLP